LCCQVTPERYMEAIAAMRPDMFVALADEVRGCVGAHACVEWKEGTYVANGRRGSTWLYKLHAQAQPHTRWRIKQALGGQHSPAVVLRNTGV
jgi:hypothetical protein